MTPSCYIGLTGLGLAVVSAIFGIIAELRDRRKGLAIAGMVVGLGAFVGVIAIAIVKHGIATPP